VTSTTAGTVTRIDPVAGQSVQTISVGADPAAIAFGFGSVWVANKLDSTVSRIDPATDALTETIPVGNGPTALAVAGTGVWVADAAAPRVPFASMRIADFTSARGGNYQHNPAAGILLDQLWAR